LIKSRKYSKGGKTRRRLAEGGGMSSRRNSSCPDGWEHLMPSGNWMCGRTHGSSGYKRGGKTMPRRKRMVRGGRARKRFETGGHAHGVKPYYHHHQGAMAHTHGGPNQEAVWDVDAQGGNSSFSAPSAINTGASAYRVTLPRIGHDPGQFVPFPYNVSSTGPRGGIGDVYATGTHPHRSAAQQSRRRGGKIRKNRKRMQMGGRMQQRNKSRVRAGSHPYTPNLSYLRKGGKV